MRLSPILQFVAGIPDTGGLIVTESREARAELIEAIHQHCEQGSAERVVIAVVSPEEMAMLRRLPNTPSLLLPNNTARRR